MIDVHNLVFEYPTKRALHDISCTVRTGSITALVGPNGAGKTTLIRCVVGLHAPLSGTVLLDGVDVLIHDAMFTPEELRHHHGWGHSSYEEAVVLAAEARVRRLVLFHHRPERDDTEMDALVDQARAAAARTGAPLEVLAAAEGLQLTL